MSEIDERVMDTFDKALPELSQLEKERLLAFGEGMAFKAKQQNQSSSSPPQSDAGQAS